MGSAFYGKLQAASGDHDEFKLFVPVLVKENIRTGRIGKPVQGKGKIGGGVADLFFILLSGKNRSWLHKWFSFKKAYLHFYCFERKCQDSVRKVEDN